MAYRGKTFRLPPEDRYGGRVMATAPPFPAPIPVTLLDGIHGYGFEPRTLYIKAQGPDFNFDDQGDRRLGVVNPKSGVTNGLITVEFRGIHLGGKYFRRFNLPTFREISIPVETFRDLKVRVIDQTGANYSVVATVTDQIMASHVPDPLFLGTRDIVAGTYSVPQGADSLIAKDADPNFAWLDLTPPQVEDTYPEAVAAGVPLEVRASAYRTNVALFRAIWRIHL